MHSRKVVVWLSAGIPLTAIGLWLASMGYAYYRCDSVFDRLTKRSGVKIVDSGHKEFVWTASGGLFSRRFKWVSRDGTDWGSGLLILSLWPSDEGSLSWFSP